LKVQAIAFPVPVPALKPDDQTPAVFMNESAGEVADDSARAVRQLRQNAPGLYLAFLTGCVREFGGF